MIETKTSGQQLVQELKASIDSPIIEIAPNDDKLVGFRQIVPIIESGKVFLPHQAVWLNDFEYETLILSKAHHNDQVDSTVQYLQWIRERTSWVADVRTL